MSHLLSRPYLPALFELSNQVSLPFPLPKQILSANDLRPKKSFGQNFLCDRSLVEKIASRCGEPGGVIEIGAGLGGLTVCLLDAGHRVIAVERDRDMIPILNQLVEAAAGKLELIEADAKSVKYEELFSQLPKPHVLSGNLPYNLTGALLRLATQLASDLQRAVFLVQLEVADRLSARPNTSNYGALSVFAQACFEVRREFVVRRGAFYPQPGVDSAVVSLVPRSDPIPETQQFRQVVNGAFAQRRKTLRNAWKSLAPPPALAAAAASCGISLDARGETLGVRDFWRMSQELENQ